MRILITGATGFIASQFVATLHEAGHDIICAVRHVASAANRFWYAKVIPCDFNHDTAIDVWQARLQEHRIDAVINCVGVLQGGRKQAIEAIHRDTPIALFSACQKVGVKRIIQISALGAGEVDTPYARTKQAADDFLLGLSGISALVIRPSVVYATGSYGGTSLFRGLSALPGIIPVVGKGDQPMMPIFLPDLARAITHYIEHPEIAGKVIYAVGGEEVTQKGMLVKLRQWLGLKKALCISVPLWLIKLTAKVGDWFQKSPINSTSIVMLEHGNVHEPQDFFASIPFKVKSFSQALASHASQTQDRWHAKLYFIRPLLRISLALLWLVSGIIPFINIQGSEALLAQVGIPEEQFDFARILLSSLDIGIGLAILARWQVPFIALLQFLIVALYTVVSLFALPSSWLEPLGPFVKNIPILVAILIWPILEDDR